METGVIRQTRAMAQALERPVEPVLDRTGPWPTVSVDAAGLRHRLELVWAGRGWPSDVKEALAKVPSPWPRQVVVIAQRLSPGSLDLLRERDANWVDEEGRARIVGPSGLLVIREAVPPSSRPITPKFRWAASALDIAELLLAENGRHRLTALELAEQSGWSHAQITKVLRHFAGAGWVEKVGPARGRGSAWRLANPALLLDAWADHVATAERERVLAHRALRDPMVFLRDELAPALAESMAWAISGWAGLEAAAPFVTTVPVLHVYVPADAMPDGRLGDVIKATALREVSEGARVEFWAASRVALELAREAASLPVASAPRLYADLRALGGRGEEAAQHVREELIGF